MKDPIGHAIKDCYHSPNTPDIKVNTNYTEDEAIPPVWFFRIYDEMPAVEKAALNFCKGKVLDVGAGAGCHTLYLQEKGFDVTALEKSKSAVQVMEKQGVKKIVNSDLYDFRNESFDTILVLMNGTGIGGTLSGLKTLLDHLKSLLNKNGQILIDSTDILYLFEEEDGSFRVDLNSSRYYGEMDYEVSYKNEKTQFTWLFTDFETLITVAAESGLKCQKVKSGENHDYLAKLTKS